MTGLTKEQVKQLVNDPEIKATVASNKVKAAKSRDADLMMLGYNQAILEQATLPEGWTTDDLLQVINKQIEKLGV